MGLEIENQSDIATPPVFIKVTSDYAGGGTLDNTGLVDKSLLRAGTFVNFDESTRLVKILKTATIVEAAVDGSTTYKIAKSVNNQAHLIVASDVVSPAVGGKSYAISGINTSNADYDIITVGTSLGAVNVGDVLFHSAASGAAAGALKVEVNGQLRNDTEVGKNVFVAVVREGITYNRRLPYTTPQAVKDALKGLIIFSEQR